MISSITLLKAAQCRFFVPGNGNAVMLHPIFNEVYTKFKLHFYQEIFRRFQDREASLTTVETFCMESIMALGRPTANEFATLSAN